LAKRQLPAWQSLPLIALLSALGVFASLLPRRVEVAFGRALGRFLFRARLFKRGIVEANLARCFPRLKGASRLALIRRNYEHYGVLVFEYMHFFSPLKGHWRRYAPTAARAEGLEHWEKARARGKGAIFFCSHLGSWEAGAAAIALGGVPATIVTTVLTPRWLHDKITACRASVGMDAAFHPGSMISVIKTLRRGGAVAFMNDQYAMPPMGLPVVFFKTRVDTLSVVGSLARRTGAVVLPLHTFRAADGTTVARIEPAFDLGASSDDPAAATQRVASRVERWVREHPENWLWMHRRFKNAPVPAGS
jgi:Kdo2-lipid IVA lauroyltransferase/acyltransferase